MQTFDRQTIKTSQRVFTAGKTGSGKTYLWRHMLSSVPRLVVLDGKGTLSNWGLADWEDREQRRDFGRGNPARLRVLAPAGERDLNEFWDDILWECYQTQDVLIYCDELYAVNQPNKPALPALHAVYTRGRELNVGMISVTQRPTWIPLVVMSEADWFFCFRLQLHEDRQRIAAFMGPDVLTPPRDKFGFYYMASEDDKPRYVRQYTAGRFK